MRFGLLGPVEVTDEGGARVVAPPRQRAILALLLLNANTVVSQSRLVDGVWGERPPETVVNALQVAVHGLRALVGAERIATHSAGYLIRVDEDELDLERFERLVTDANVQPPAEAAATLREALRVWRGEALADVREAPFAATEAARLEEARLAALLRRIELDLALGKHAELLPELNMLVALHPLQEKPACLLITSLYRTGRQAEALEAYRATRNRLVTELGIEPGPELRSLEQAILTHDPALGPSSAPTPVASAGLPAPPNALVGRRLELAAVEGLLRRAEVRLVTLTGAGGTGKTRLAVEAASALAPELPDGALFVDLAPLEAPELVASTVARALGALESGDEPVAAALAALRGRTLLLVLDNFEQVDEAAPIVSELLLGAPGLTVLATSRSALRLSGEWVYPVSPLRVPARDELRDPTRLRRNEAVALFAARAEAASHGFALTDDVAAAVGEICIALDGLPLALELAATHCRRLSPQELLARLGERLELLTEGPRDLPTRQRTLRAAIEWSHELLEPAEQRLFAALGVFSGGCTAASEEVVCGFSERALETLVDQSLLRRDAGTDGIPRYRMLDTVRAYSVERLHASGEETRLRARHASHFRDVAEQAAAELWSPVQGPSRAAWLARLTAEEDNMRAALTWADTRDDDTQLAIAAALFDYWHVRGAYREGRHWLERALARPSGSDALRARALHALSFFDLGLGDAERAEAVGEECLALFRSLGDREGTGRTIHLLGHAAEARGDPERALALARESLDLARELDHTRGIIVSLGHVGDLLASNGDRENGRRLVAEAGDLARAHGDDTALASLSLTASKLERVAGDRDAAVAHALEGLDLGLAYDMKEGVARALGELVLLAEETSPIDAARLLGAADLMREEVGRTTPAHPEAAQAAVRLADRIGAATFEAARAEGRDMSPGFAARAAFDK